MSRNFVDLTVDSQVEIFERLCAFDVAAEWVATFSGMPKDIVRQVLLGAGKLETANRNDDEIAIFWADIDASKNPIP